MKNIFLPSDTIACVEDTWVHRIKKDASDKTVEITEEIIRKYFDDYVRELKEIFELKALVVTKTRAIGDGVFVPYLAYEFVTRDVSVKSYVDAGYYAVTVNGYRISDIIDAAMCNFKSSPSYSRYIVKQVKDDIENDTGSETVVLNEAAIRLADFFFTNPYRSFDSYLMCMYDTPDHTGYNRKEFAKKAFGITVAFANEDIPFVSDPTEIYSICHEAQNAGLAADESDIDGWKNGNKDSRHSDVIKFFDYIGNLFGVDMGLTHNTDKKSCPPECGQQECQRNDPIEKIKKCVDDRNNKNDNVARSKTPNADSNYYYYVTYTDKDGKVHKEEYVGDEAKNKILEGAKAQSRCDDDKMKCENDPVDDMNKRMDRLEKIIEKLSRNREDLPATNPLDIRWPYTQDYRPWWTGDGNSTNIGGHPLADQHPFDISPIMTMFGF